MSVTTAGRNAVIHCYYQKGGKQPVMTTDGQVVMVVVYKRADEGGIHLPAPYAGTELKLTAASGRQYEEMPEDRCRKLRQILQDIRED